MALKFGDVGAYDSLQDWQTYEGRFRFFLEANGVTEASRKRVVLLSTIGPTAFKVVENLNAPTVLTDNAVTFETLVEQLRAFYGKKPSLMAARSDFTRLSQRENQTVDEFALELRVQAAKCDFGAELTTRLRDQFVAGVHSERARKRLMERDTISLEDAEKLARDLERVDREYKPVAGEQHVSQLTHTQASKNKSGPGSGGARLWGKQSSRRSEQQQQRSRDATQISSDVTNNCQRCGGTQHDDDQCPYKLNSWECRACGTAGHKASMCRLKKKASTLKPTAIQQKHVEARAQEGGDDLTVMGVAAEPARLPLSEFRLEIQLNDKPLMMELDTGAEASVAPKSVWTLLGCPKLQAAPRRRAYGGASLPLLGQADVDVLFHGETKRLNIVFLQCSDAVPLFGVPWIRAFNPINLRAVTVEPGLNKLLSEYSDLFDT